MCCFLAKSSSLIFGDGAGDKRDTLRACESKSWPDPIFCSPSPLSMTIGRGGKGDWSIIMATWASSS